MTLGSSFILGPLYLLREALSLSPELMDLSTLAGPWDPELLLSLASDLCGVTHTYYIQHLTFCIGAGGQNSGPCVCSASPFPVEPSSLPKGLNFIS